MLWRRCHRGEQEEVEAKGWEEEEQEQEKAEGEEAEGKLLFVSLLDEATGWSVLSARVKGQWLGGKREEDF